jgi:hypothetical protein
LKQAEELLAQNERLPADYLKVILDERNRTEGLPTVRVEQSTTIKLDADSIAQAVIAARQAADAYLGNVREQSFCDISTPAQLAAGETGGQAEGEV